MPRAPAVGKPPRQVGPRCPNVSAAGCCATGSSCSLLGLATGRLVQLLPLPRMGLSSHLQGVMNGTFLVVLGLIWPHLRLHALLLRAAYWLALVGTYLNWAVTLAAAAWGLVARPCRWPLATTWARLTRS